MTLRHRGMLFWAMLTGLRLRAGRPLAHFQAVRSGLVTFLLIVQREIHHEAWLTWWLLAMPPQELACVSTVTAGVMVREHADMSARAIAVLPPGQAVPGLGYDASGAWAQVIVEERTGWVSLSVVECLEITPTPTPTVIAATPTDTSTPIPTDTPTPTPAPAALILVPPPAAIVTVTPLEAGGLPSGQSPVAAGYGPRLLLFGGAGAALTTAALLSWQRRSKRGKPLQVLLATQNAEAIRAAAEQVGETRRREAFTTGGALRLVKGANLVVLDPDDLTETDGATREALAAGVRGSGAVVVSGGDFAADPVRYESEARLSVGDLRAFPARTVAHINYAGGVGKTTLSLDLAAYFTRRTKLPAAVIELSQGASALHALIDPSLPHFYDMLTQGMEPAVWRGVTLVPMVFGSARLVLDGAHEPALAFVETLRRRHVLTIFDVVAAHPLWPDVRPMVDQVYVVVSPKPDSVLQAEVVVDDMREFAKGAGPGDVRFIANLVSGPRDRVALAGLDCAVMLPRIGSPERFDGRLGRRLMSVVYLGFLEG